MCGDILKFKLVENFGILDEDSGSSTRRTIKTKLIKALRADPNEKYVLHHKHNEKYNPDDEDIILEYNDIENAVLIPMSKAKQKQGNDLHLLIHYMAQHKNELDEPFCLGIENGHIKKYTIRELVNIL